MKFNNVQREKIIHYNQTIKVQYKHITDRAKHSCAVEMSTNKLQPIMVCSLMGVAVYSVKALVAMGEMLLRDVLYSKIIPEKVHPSLRSSVLLWHNSNRQHIKFCR